MNRLRFSPLSVSGCLPSLPYGILTGLELYGSSVEFEQFVYKSWSQGRRDNRSRGTPGEGWNDGLPARMRASMLFLFLVGPHRHCFCPGFSVVLFARFDIALIVLAECLLRSYRVAMLFSPWIERNSIIDLGIFRSAHSPIFSAIDRLVVLF